MGAGKILEALVSDFFFKPLFFFIKSSCVLVESKVFFFSQSAISSDWALAF